MCLDLWCDLGSLAHAIAPLLSQNRSTGFEILGTTPSPVMNFLIQTTSLVAYDAAIYSASVVESATLSCFELFQLIAPPFKQNTKHNCDMKSSLLDWKLALV